jgi:hypothetical protein
MVTVRSMGENPERQIAVLQAQVRERLADLRPIRPGAERYTAASDAVIAAAAELIEYEERLPLLLDQAPRRLSLLIVRWSGIVSAAVGFSLTVAALVGWLSHWWLPMVVVLFGAAALLLRMPVPAPGDRHLPIRPGALMVAIGALVIVFGAVLRLPLWVVGLGTLLLLVGLWRVRADSITTTIPARSQGRW